MTGVESITFQFDTLPFMNGIDKIAGGMNRMFATISNAGQRVGGILDKFRGKTEQVGKPAIQAAQVNPLSNGIEALTRKVVGLGAAFLGVRAIMNRLPEVGQAFSIAGDIIQKNLFWPLRQELVPMLQDMLRWVTANRKMFVQAGVVIRNVFRGIVAIVKSLIEIVKKMYDQLNGYLKKIFGNTTRTISETIKILIFKLFVLAQFIIMILEPVFKMIGTWIGTIVTGFRGLVDGFKSGVPLIAEALGHLGDSLKQLGEFFSIGTDSAQKFYSIMYGIGQILSGVVAAAFTLIAQNIDNIVTGIRGLGLAYDWIKAKTSGTKEDVNKAEEAIKGAGSDWWKRTMTRGGTLYKSGEKVMEGASKVPILSELTGQGESKMMKTEVKQEINVTVNDARDVEKVVAGATKGMNNNLKEIKNRQ